MEFVTAVVIGLLFGTGTFLMLTRSITRVVIGSTIISYGVNLMLLTSGQLKRGPAPILREGVTIYADPVPQALVLTAIVIGFAVTAFMFILAWRAVEAHGTDDLAALQGE